MRGLVTAERPCWQYEIGALAAARHSRMFLLPSAITWNGTGDMLTFF